MGYRRICAIMYTDECSRGSRIALMDLPESTRAGRLRGAATIGHLSNLSIMGCKGVVVSGSD